MKVGRNKKWRATPLLSSLTPDLLHLESHKNSAEHAKMGFGVLNGTFRKVELGDCWKPWCLGFRLWWIFSSEPSRDVHSPEALIDLQLFKQVSIDICVQVVTLKFPWFISRVICLVSAEKRTVIPETCGPLRLFHCSLSLTVLPNYQLCVLNWTSLTRKPKIPNFRSIFIPHFNLNFCSLVPIFLQLFRTVFVKEAWRKAITLFL